MRLNSKYTTPSPKHVLHLLKFLYRSPFTFVFCTVPFPLHVLHCLAVVFLSTTVLLTTASLNLVRDKTGLRFFLFVNLSIPILNISVHFFLSITFLEYINQDNCSVLEGFIGVSPIFSHIIRFISFANLPNSSLNSCSTLSSAFMSTFMPFISILPSTGRNSFIILTDLSKGLLLSFLKSAICASNKALVDTTSCLPYSSIISIGIFSNETLSFIY